MDVYMNPISIPAYSQHSVAATLHREIPFTTVFDFLLKNYKSYRDETLYYLLRDQFTHGGQISDPSVQNFRRKSRR